MPRNLCPRGSERPEANTLPMVCTSPMGRTIDSVAVLAQFAWGTRRLAKALGRIGIALGGAAGARLARGLGMPVSRDIFRALPLPAVEPPRAVGVDDWAREYPAA